MFFSLPWTSVIVRMSKAWSLFNLPSNSPATGNSVASFLPSVGCVSAKRLDSNMYWGLWFQYLISHPLQYVFFGF